MHSEGDSKGMAIETLRAMNTYEEMIIVEVFKFSVADYCAFDITCIKGFAWCYILNATSNKKPLVVSIALPFS